MSHQTANHLSIRTHRRLIGALGLALPILLYLVAGARPTHGLPDWELLTSVSAYSYTGAVGILVGVLFALSLFLFSYPGYKGVHADRVAGVLGGIAALGVALFPTAAPGSLPEPDWWSPVMGTVHHTSAVVLFGVFIVFAIWLFRKSSIPKRRDRPADKRRRDDACLACGVIMIAAVLWAVVAAMRDASIFVPEALAIMAFAVSWLVKGEAHGPVLGVFRRMTSS